MTAELSEIKKVLSQKRAITSIEYLLDLQARALAGEYVYPFSEYISKFGILKNDSDKFVGTQDRLLDEYTTRVIGRKIDARERRLLQFSVGSCTPAMNSDTLYEKAMKLLNEKDFFEPENILKINNSKLELIIKRIGSRNEKSVAQAWKENAQLLVDKYSSDPKNMFENDMHPLDLFKMINSLREYGIKTSALLLKEYIESGIYNPGENLKYVPIPGDIHVIRFIIKSSISNPAKASEVLNHSVHGTLSKRIQDFLAEIILKTNMNPVKVDDAIWIWAREICSPDKINCVCSSYCPNQPYHNQIYVGYSRRMEQSWRHGKRDGKIKVLVNPNKTIHTFRKKTLAVPKHLLASAFTPYCKKPKPPPDEKQKRIIDF